MKISYPTPRLEAFTDAVLAIIITLMVLELKVPHLAESANDYSIWHSLEPLGHQLFAYLLSFLILAVYWLNHHRVLVHTEHLQDGALLANLLFIFFICLVPFPTALLGEHPDSHFSMALLAGLLCLCSMSFALFRATIHSTKNLLNFRSWVGPVGYALATVLAFYIPLASKLICLVIPIYYLLPLHLLKNSKE